MSDQVTDQVEAVEQEVSRRNFLRLFWRGLGIVVGGEAAYLGLSFLASRKPASSTGEIVTAGLVSDFQPGTVTPFNEARFFLLRAEAGGFLALYSRCTHLACIVGWEADKHEFACPCHGSIFGEDGHVINPPAPRPLDYFPLTIEDDGRVLVDTRKAIARDVVDDSALVYPSEQAEQAAQSTAEPTAGS